MVLGFLHFWSLTIFHLSSIFNLANQVIVTFENIRLQLSAKPAPMFDIYVKKFIDLRWLRLRFQFPANQETQVGGAARQGES